MKTQNREEIFLKALANGEEPNIKPLTRKEILLKKQAERESASGGGGRLHWDDIEGKPFYSKKTVVLDFPLDPNTIVDDQEVPEGWTKRQTNMATWEYSIHISDTPLSYFEGIEDFIGVNAVFYDNGVEKSIKIIADNVSESGVTVTNGNSKFVLNSDWEIVVEVIGSTYTYLPNNYLMRLEKEEIQTIDPKYLPEDYLKQLIAEVTGTPS